ncbi:MAG TPA: sterol desaturase [Verrucomicrobiales bacterium]|nr:sterol desaturase [Verrucomicrobiales bacterium]
MRVLDLLFGTRHSFLERSLFTTLEVGLRYFLFAGVAWILAYWLFRNRWFHRKIIPRFPASADVRREIGYSLLTLVIFGVMGAGTIAASRAGWTQMYWRISERGTGWFAGSIACAILVHDTYFYWTHRLMHHPRLFTLFHKVHHLSTNPSPWAAYSFAPAEAVVEAGIFPVVATLMPIHPLAFGLVMLWQILFNVAGHTGFEFHPTWLMRTPLRLILNTPTNHVMHHEKMRGNYGLYFNIWDRLMGTNHPDYESRFREVTSRRSSQTAA